MEFSRSREGRASFFKLTPVSMEITMEASAKIYKDLSQQKASEGTWQLVIVPRLEGSDYALIQLQEYGFVAVTNRVFAKFVTAGDAPVVIESSDIITLTANTLGALSQSNMYQLVTQNHKTDPHFQHIITSFTPLCDLLTAGASIKPLDALAARVLLIHFWRRAILLDEFENLDNKVKTDAFALTKKLYHLLLPLSEAWLIKHSLEYFETFRQDEMVISLLKKRF